MNARTISSFALKINTPPNQFFSYEDWQRFIHADLEKKSIAELEIELERTRLILILDRNPNPWFLTRCDALKEELENAHS